MKRLFSVFMALAIIFTSAFAGFPLTEITAQAATNGVQSQIDKLRAVYPTGSYFSKDGKIDNGSNHTTINGITCQNCYLPNIPARGGLPSGAAVGVTAEQCASFAYYAYYVIFGHNHGTKTTNTSSPVLGDMIHVENTSSGAQHWFIYLSEDSSNYYVYDANWGYTQQVNYNHAIGKSGYNKRTIYHATDYSNVQPAEDITYSDITPAAYYFLNNGTGLALNLDHNTDANLQNVHMYEYSPGYTTQQMVVSLRSSTDKSYKIRPTISNRLVQTYGNTGVTTSGMNVNIYDDVNDNTQWWHFQSVLGGYVIRNAANTSCVLTASNGDAIVSTYTGSSNQIWTLQPVNQKYTVSYNANGGSGTMANTEMTVGTAASLRANTFTRTGYTFLGWSTSASATSATYTDKQSVKDLAKSGTITLYAVWSRINEGISGLNAVANSNSITLTWNYNPTASYYIVYADLKGVKIGETQLSSNATTYTFTGLQSNTKYALFVKTVWSDGSSETMPYDATTATAIPSKVAGFKGTATDKSIKLSWTKNTTADSYKLKQLVNGTYKEIVKTANNSTTSYTVSGLKANTEYTFAIYAFNGTQFSAVTKITVKTTAANPTAVTNFKGTATDTTVKLSWTKNTTADSYKIKQLVNGTYKEIVKTANNSTTSYTVSGLKANTEYTFAIYAFNGTQFSAVTKVTVKTTAAKPTAVMGFKGTATDTTVKLSWTKNTTADSYKIKQLVNGAYKEIVKTANNSTTSYTVSGLKANTEYTFAIYAFNGTQFSSVTKVTVKTTDAKPTAVTGFKGTATETSIKLSWTKNTTADSYKIKQLVDGAYKEIVKTTNNSTTSYTVSGLKENTEYSFAIYAFKGTQFSAVTKLTIRTTGKPTVVTGFKGAVASDFVKLSWNKNSSADSYKIKQLVNGKYQEIVKTANNSTTSYTVNGLKANTEYKFAIYAFNGTRFSNPVIITVKTAG